MRFQKGQSGNFLSGVDPALIRRCSGIDIFRRWPASGLYFAEDLRGFFCSLQ